ncbi:MAG: septum site-determining protein MinC [Oceanospirillaceae bacterium]|nr:septum site-determining protein MinC [Oceanospirillaceae bacterium]
MVQHNALIKETEIKGSLFPLSILQLDGTDLAVLTAQLDARLQQTKDFFYRAPLVINIEKTQGALLNFKQLKQVIETRDFVCVGVCNATPEQAIAAIAAGLATLKQPRSDAAKLADTQPLKAAEREANPALPKAAVAAKVITKPVRSGQQIYAKNSDLIIIGSVSNGAEVVADGNIHIYGQLRGRALAGASGATNAIIYCHSMEAELVSIAGNYWLSDQLPPAVWRQSALFKYESGKLSAQPIGPTSIKN